MDNSPSPRHPERGISMIELLVALTVMALVAVIGFPALMNTLRKSQIQSAIQETQSLMRAARLQAIKQSGPIGVARDTAEGRFVSYRNDTLGSTDDFEPGTDEVIAFAQLARDIDFRAPGTETVIDGFGGNDYVLFESTGSVEDSGAFRIGDQRGNFFEIRVDPPATGRVDVRKWEEFPEGSGTFQWMSQGQQDHSWRWN